MNDSVTIHQLKLLLLTYEIFKSKNKLSPGIMNNAFEFKEPHYSLRKATSFCSRNVKTVLYGTESISVLAPKIWKLVLSEIRNYQSFYQFKKEVSTWTTTNCPCCLCKKIHPKCRFYII